MSESEIVQTEGDWRVVLEYDEYGDTESPRGEGTGVGIFWCRHPRYNLGDINADEFDELNRFVDLMLEYHHGSEVTRAVVKHLVRHYKATVVRPLYLYDHSGLSLSAGENLVSNEYDTDLQRRRHFVGDYGGWDTSYIGFVFDTEKSREHVEDAAAAIDAEVTEYDSYLQNDVHIVTVQRRVITETIRRDPATGEVLDEAEDDDTWDDVESCGGFIGHEYAVQEAREMLAGHLSPTT